MGTRRKIALLIALVAASATLAASVPANGTFVRDPLDFRALYCAGGTLIAGHDPYLAEPLRSCEATLMRAAGQRPYTALAIPAPLPAYSLAPFALFALLPFALASNLMTLLLVVAVAGTVLILARLTAYPIVGILAAIVVSDGYYAIAYGQITPFAILALCACARALACERPGRAALFAVAAMIEPHLGLPACIALAVLRPETRRALILGALCCGLLSLVVADWHTDVEYLTRVLPAHARSELAADVQFSLASVLWRLGFAREAAVRVSEIDYAAMIGFGVWTAARLSSRYRRSELVALIPPAFAVAGGPFVHLTQIAAAIPALLVLLSCVPERRAVFACALVVLALPWIEVTRNGPVLTSLIGLAVTAPIVATIWRPQRRVAALALAATVATCVVETAVQAAHPAIRHDPAPAIAAVASAHALAEATWQAFSSTHLLRDDEAFLAFHLPTWIGLGMLVATTLVASRTAAPHRADATCPNDLAHGESCAVRTA